MHCLFVCLQKNWKELRADFDDILGNVDKGTRERW